MSLTPKQEAFCKCIVSGMSGKDSYITAYNNNSNDNTSYKEAMKLLAREDIQERIKELNKPLEIHAQARQLSAREEQIKEIKDRINICKENKDEASLIRYYDMLNKIYSLYGKEEENIKDTTNNIEKLDNDTLNKIIRIG